MTSSRKAPARKTARPKNKKICGVRDIAAMIKAIGDQVIQEFPDHSKLLVLGIRTRGVTLAERLRVYLEKNIGADVASGILDITLYRDDLSALGPQPMVRDSDIPHDVTGANVILVDDVLFTGRTVRAAMDEIVDFGRPARIRLAVLVDRGHREYPIQADYVGKTVETDMNQIVHVHLKEVDSSDEILMETSPG